ncbi:MAG: sulfotransferase family 2 domain-containing protein [Pseudomonadota bacterium]
MIISHKLQLFHVHVPKTGGTTINAVIKSWDPSAENLTERGHEPLSFIANTFPKIFSEYLSIACVRNPWARVVSLYDYRKISIDRIPQGGWPPHWPSRDQVNSMSFHEFLNEAMVEDECEICPPRDAEKCVWLEPSCSAWISIGRKIAIDRVLRTETLGDDLKKLGSELGVTGRDIPRLNQGVKRNYQDAYDRSQREFVGKRYDIDVENFGYRFN